MFPLGTTAALINENGSRCVSSGLAQLAFWVGSSSTVGACSTRAWTPKSTAGGSVKGDISKEEVWLLRRALAWGLFYCEKPAASAERDATSALGNPGDDTSGGCEDVLSQLHWHWFTARKSHWRLLDELTDKTCFCYSKRCFEFGSEPTIVCWISMWFIIV